MYYERLLATEADTVDRLLSQIALELNCADAARISVGYHLNAAGNAMSVPRPVNMADWHMRHTTKAAKHTADAVGLLDLVLKHEEAAWLLMMELRDGLEDSAIGCISADSLGDAFAECLARLPEVRRDLISQPSPVGI